MLVITQASMAMIFYTHDQEVYGAWFAGLAGLTLVWNVFVYLIGGRLEK